MLTWSNLWKNIPGPHWDRAVELRRQSTLAERKLWWALRNYSTRVKFRRQQPIGPYIVDFYSADCKLVIEVDGETHILPGAPEYDREREEYLKARGFKVKRYTNRQVRLDLDGVVADILADIGEI